MEESGGSESSSSISSIFVKYKQKLKDFVANRLSIESPNSNINININMPSTSRTLFSVCVGNLVATKKDVTKKQDCKKTAMQAHCQCDTINGNSDKESKTDNKTDSEEKDVNCTSSRERDYSKLTTKELDRLAKRICMYDKTGIVLSDSDDKDVIPCKNKYKGKKKNTGPKLRGPQVPGTSFGKGDVGVAKSRFGARPCNCCNGSKRKCTKDSNTCEPRNTPFASTSYCNMMSEELSESFKKREERLLQIQQRNLLNHPEILGTFVGDGDSSEDETPLPPIELPPEKLELIQKFIDSMAAERIDYEKPKLKNIVKGISQDVYNRLSIRGELPSTSAETSTIVERVDFRNKLQRKLSQSKINRWLRKSKSFAAFSAHLCNTKELHTTSTPLQKQSKPDTSNAKECVPGSLQPILFETDIANSATVITATPVVDNAECYPSTSAQTDTTCKDDSLDLSHLDRSNITLRKTPGMNPPGKHTHENVRCHPDDPKPLNFVDESNLMNFVDELLASEQDDIHREAQERCDRILQSARQTQTALNNALDGISITDEASADVHDLDNSVQIIEDTVYPRSSTPTNASDDSVQLIAYDQNAFNPLTLNDDDVQFVNGPIVRRSLRKRAGVAHSTNKKTKKRRQNVPELDAASSSNVNKLEQSTTNKQEEEKPSSKRLRDCPICLESLDGKEISSTICGHVFCTPCITASVRKKKSCPNCRTALTLKKIHPLFI